jgi:outer membrane protein assembly factor BamB
MGDLFCLDSSSGRVVWQKNFVRDYGAEVPIYGYASPPLVDGDRLITMVGGQGQAVVALDRHTGQPLWKAANASEPGYCAPLVRTLDGKRQIVVWHANALAGLEPESGRLLWSVHHPLTAGMAIPTPAIEGRGTSVWQAADERTSYRTPASPQRRDQLQRRGSQHLGEYGVCRLPASGEP